MRYLALFTITGFLLAACTSMVGSSTPVSESPEAVLVEPTTQTPPTSTTTISPTQTTTKTSTSAATLTLVPTNTFTVAESIEQLPGPSEYFWSPFIEGLNTPIFVTDAGDGSSTLYVVSQAGFIYSIRDGALSDQPFLDISDRTSTTRQNGTYGERGLLGLAFHPEYERNGFFFVNYTDREGNTHISRFTRRGDADFLADPDSEAEVLFVAQPYPNHNGGGLSFGPDGFLYIALGDGGSGGDPLGSGQSLQTYLGKILRIDVDLGQPYAVPPTNPFAQGGGLPEIWAYGLRNPWRIAFDPLTGDLYIADVGQNAYEEVNFQPASSQGGENYGWNYREGSHIYIDTPAGVTGLVEPAAEYDHGLGCSITGGVVYRGLNLPEWQGVYLYGDYCSGRIWGLLSNPDRTWQQALLFETGFRISSFGTDRDGEVYVIDYGSGKLFRLDRR